MTRKKEGEGKPEKHAGGRPTDYGKVNLSQVHKLAMKGFTDAEIADFIEVAPSTYYLWKREHPEFSESINLGKEEADRKVERSLFECATGYSHPDTHFAVCDGVVVQTPTIKHYKPDNTAQIFWLKNRKPAEWRDKTEVQDDRLTALLMHMNRTKEESNGKETQQPPARTGKRAGPGPLGPGCAHLK